MANVRKQFAVTIMIRAVLVVEADTPAEAGSKANDCVHEAITHAFQKGQYKRRQDVKLRMIGRFPPEEIDDPELMDMFARLDGERRLPRTLYDRLADLARYRRRRIP